MLSFILSIVYGAIAGWIASKIMNTQGGTLRNIITGIVGGMIGSFLFRLVGFYASGFFANLIVSVIGACIFIFGRQEIIRPELSLQLLTYPDCRTYRQAAVPEKDSGLSVFLLF